MNLKLRLQFVGVLCLGLVLLQTSPSQAGIPGIAAPDPPDGPYAISINVFLDPYYLPKMEDVKVALRDSAASLKKNLNLEVTWYIHGRVFVIKKWHPAKDAELTEVLAKKVHKKVSADANIVFTNRSWIKKFYSLGFGRINCEPASVHGFFYSGSSTIIIYHTSKCVGSLNEDGQIECNKNSVVIAHEIGHFLGLKHDHSPMSMMFDEYNPNGGLWLNHNVKEAKANMCYRGYLACS